MQTKRLGGVTTPTPEDFATMQRSQYILHAHDGIMSKVPAEKSTLPHDPKGHVQTVETALAPDGTVYVNQNTMLCKSTDGGRSWSVCKRAEDMAGQFQILGDGTFISAQDTSGDGSNRAISIFASSDEGRSWQEISPIPIPEKYSHRYLYRLYRATDDTLLCGVSCRALVLSDDGAWQGGIIDLVAYRSTDGGRSWDDGNRICDWGSEGGIVQTASGKLMAAVRYQRPSLPTDPPDLQKETGSGNSAYKHIFLADSPDVGVTWTNFRQLTTVFGQCHGFPTALSDGTVVVIHDSRYPRDLDAGRAMVSRDEGETWEDEVYYMYYGLGISGYSQSVVLEDDLILTIAGTTDNLEAHHSWHAAVGHSTLTAIRWRVVAA